MPLDGGKVTQMRFQCWRLSGEVSLFLCCALTNQLLLLKLSIFSGVTVWTCRLKYGRKVAPDHHCGLIVAVNNIRLQ